LAEKSEAVRDGDESDAVRDVGAMLAGSATICGTAAQLGGLDVLPILLIGRSVTAGVVIATPNGGGTSSSASGGMSAYVRCGSSGSEGAAYGGGVLETTVPGKYRGMKDPAGPDMGGGAFPRSRRSRRAARRRRR